MAAPLLSVILLVRDAGAHLPEVVESIRRQTWRDWELIAWDNGSTDGSVEFLRGWDEPRLRLRESPENVGIATATQAALDEARGEYVILADHDDVQHPDRFARQVAALAAEPTWAAVAGGAVTTDGAGRRIGREFSLVRAEDFARYTAWSTGVVSPAFCYRRERLSPHRRRPVFRWASDYDVLARLADQEVIGGDAAPVLSYRRHATQVTARHGTAMAAEEGVVRLLTARRRAGRAEEAEPWGTWLESRREVRDEATIHAELTAIFEAENERALAALHARRWWVSARGRERWAAWRAGARLALTGGAGAMRAWLGGPVRYYGVRPSR